MADFKSKACLLFIILFEKNKNAPLPSASGELIPCLIRLNFVGVMLNNSNFNQKKVNGLI